MPPMVSATAAPRTNGPSTLPTEASTIAWNGVAARVATSAAIALDASCRPFVTAKRTARAIAARSPVSTAEPRSPDPQSTSPGRRARHRVTSRRSKSVHPAAAAIAPAAISPAQAATSTPSVIAVP